MRLRMMLATTIGAVGLALALACGGGGDGASKPSPSPEAPPFLSDGSVAPNVFMTFQGQRHQAVDVGSDLVTRDQVELAGTTDQIDIDHSGPVAVYRLRDGPADTLYTFQPARSAPEEEGGSTPDVWLQWAPADTGSIEPGSTGGSAPGGAPPATIVEPVAPPPGAGPTLSPDDVVSATPAPGGTTEPDTSALVEAARSHLARRLAVGAEEIRVVSVQEEYLPHPSCLGLGPGEACIQVAARGYRVILAAGDGQYEYYAYSEAEVYPAP